jgi:TrmH family RNA methyltransferase
MGAHNRLSFACLEPDELLNSYSDICYVLALDGKDMTELDYPEAGILVVGNESKGVGKKIMDRTDHHIRIEKNGGAESLNASIACGIASFHISNSIKA